MDHQGCPPGSLRRRLRNTLGPGWRFLSAEAAVMRSVLTEGSEDVEASQETESVLLT